MNIPCVMPKPPLLLEKYACCIILYLHMNAYISNKNSWVLKFLLATEFFQTKHSLYQLWIPIRRSGHAEGYSMPSNYFSPDKKLRLNYPTYSFFHLGAKLGSWLTPRPSCFTPGSDLIPLYRRMGGPQVWADTENLAPNRIRSPDRPARSDSLYRLSYPGHTTTKTTTANENVNMITHNSYYQQKTGLIALKTNTVRSLRISGWNYPTTRQNNPEYLLLE
jgi:hypothetical protein